MSSSGRLELNRILKDIDVVCDCVIDIGGSQEPIKGRTKSWDVEEYYIGDLEDPHVDSPKPDFVVDLNKNTNDIIGYMGMADVLFCLEVLDYIYDPVNAFKTLKKLMKVGGVMYISCQLYYPLHNPVEADSARYTEYGIRNICNKVGLTVEEVYYRRPETHAVEFLWRQERMRAAKHHDHNYTGYVFKVRR